MSRTTWALSAVSGIALALCFPPFSGALLSLVALVPLLLALRGLSPAQAFGHGLLTGLLFFILSLSWINNTMVDYGGLGWPLSLALLCLLCAYLALYVACFAALVPLTARLELAGRLFVPAGLWCGLELCRAQALTGFPWNSLGYALVPLLPLTQTADLWGVHGQSALIVLTNLGILEVALGRGRRRGLALLALLLLWGLVGAYGASRVGQPESEQRLTAAVVQGNIPQAIKWDREMQLPSLERYEALTRTASAQGATLVIWPEESVTFHVRQHALFERLRNVARELRLTLAVGGPDVEPNAGSTGKEYNALVFIDGQGEVSGVYHKVHLVPFGEYVPLKPMLFFVERMVLGPLDLASGEEVKAISAGQGLLVAPSICYEAIFPAISRRGVISGGRLLVNVTNDSWFGDSAASEQHFLIARLRAIELKTPLLRAAGTGISGIVDSRGRVLAKSALFEEAVLVASVELRNQLTFYARHGDFLCWILASVAFLTLFLADPARRCLLSRGRRRPRQRANSRGTL